MAKRVALLAGLSLLAAGCDDRPQGEQKPEQENGAAESERTDHPADYQAAKAAAEATIEAELGEARVDPSWDELVEGRFDLINCLEEVDDGNRRPTGRDASLEMLAMRIARLEARLARRGYSGEIFHGPLQGYERQVLAAIAAAGPTSGQDRPGLTGADADELLAGLAREMDANRARLQPDLPAIVAEGGCGAGGTQFLVKPVPDGGRAWLITRFSFNLCKAKGVDPWDRDKCDRWNEADPDRPAYLGGTYVYQARWPNGATGRGVKRIESAETDPAEPPVVTIRPD